MSRLDGALSGPVTAEQRGLHDEIVHGRRAARPPAFPLLDDRGQLNGPARAWLLQPRLGAGLEKLGAAVTYDMTLPVRCREAVILTVAQHHASPFELYAHRLAGVRAGLSPAETESLCTGRTPQTADARERAAVEAARTLLETGGLDDAAYREADRHLGAAGLFEVTTLVGFYTLIALQLNVYAIRPPAEPDRAASSVEEKP